MSAVTLWLADFDSGPCLKGQASVRWEKTETGGRCCGRSRASNVRCRGGKLRIVDARFTEHAPKKEVQILASRP